MNEQTGYMIGTASANQQLAWGFDQESLEEAFWVMKPFWVQETVDVCDLRGGLGVNVDQRRRRYNEKPGIPCSGR
jgi:hypothetical protein